MDSSYSESDISMSPSKILEKLQILRQIQLLQRSKLEKHQLLLQETTETSSSVTEIVSHFSSSPSYNTFRSLLQSPRSNCENTPRTNGNDQEIITPRDDEGHLMQQVSQRDLIDGISMLNLSQESEFLYNTPSSAQSRLSLQKNDNLKNGSTDRMSETSTSGKKHISLDEMPILQTKTDFKTLLDEKLKNDIKINNQPKSNNLYKPNNKKPFLKKGEGMSRFGINKQVVIQNTNSLPWRRKTSGNNIISSPLLNKFKKNSKNKVNDPPKVAPPISNLGSRQCIQAGQTQCMGTQQLFNNVENCPISEDSHLDAHTHQESLPKLIRNKSKQLNKPSINIVNEQEVKSPPYNNNNNIKTSKLDGQSQNVCIQNIVLPKIKEPILKNMGKTWASVLSKEQDDFLRKLKQSEYYKNFASPTKSTVSDTSCSESLIKLKQDKEDAEQNMFELIESKVSHESFTLDNSFFNKFIKKNNLECSGESTPLVMQRALANNPSLIHINPEINGRKPENTYNEAETCNSEYTDCCSECCVSQNIDCCDCNNCENQNESAETYNKSQTNKKYIPVTTKNPKSKDVLKNPDHEIVCQTDLTNHENNSLKANMAEMNEKLVATSELLKDRLRELEEEIDTFRKENANLSKMREEIDLERQKLYEEKQTFEQKFNEEKILSEYYLAEEKEKLMKQKQTYERYVREMRGRLNKKEKDEVVSLKKEINELKDEIRLKDAKSTSTIARLRNQINIMNKEKKEYQTEIEKFKTEIKRIQHSNEVTRRLTNIKYLEEINKKLSAMNSKNATIDVELDKDVKYRTFEIERQSRSRKTKDTTKNKLRTRAKSVPNLNVTSRYAKYFSQRDVLSEKEVEDIVNVESYNNLEFNGINESFSSGDLQITEDRHYEKEDENNLEKIYLERFKKLSPRTDSSIQKSFNEKINIQDSECSDEFFIPSSSNRESKSPNQISFPSSNTSSRSNSFRSKSPTTILSHRPSSSKRSSHDSQSTKHLLNQHVQSTASFSMSKSLASILTNRIPSSKATLVNREIYEDKRMVLSPEPTISKTSLTKTKLTPTEITKPDGSKELIFPNGNKKFISADGDYTKFLYYNGDIKENFFNEGRIKYFYAETKTYHTTHADGLEVLEFSDGQVEKRYKDGSSEIRLPNGSVRYYDPKNEHVREEWRFPDGATVTVSSNGEQRILFSNGQIEVYAKDHKRREFPDGTVKLVYNDGTSETRYSSGRVRIKDKNGTLIMDSATT